MLIIIETIPSCSLSSMQSQIYIMMLFAGALGHKETKATNNETCAMMTASHRRKLRSIFMVSVTEGRLAAFDDKTSINPSFEHGWL